MPERTNRRRFWRSSSGALAAVPALPAQRGAHDRLGFAGIGVGTRGHTLLQQAQAVPNTEVRIICDLYEGNIRRAKSLCSNPNVRTVHEWEKAVADPWVDAVIIATPDFWHAPMVLCAAEAKKDVNVEKGWCSPDVGRIFPPGA